MNFLAGYRTYIAAALAALVAANAILGIVPQYVQDAILAFAAALGLYGIRAAIAKQDPDPAGASRYIGAAIAVALLLGVASSAAAQAPVRKTCFPWPSSVNDRLKALEAQRQQQPPPAPQTDPAVTAALQQLAENQRRMLDLLARQQLPIDGTPRQVLPPDGTPRQILPPDGTPKQVLPPDGTPRQVLPPSSVPKQDLPIGGPPRQELPGSGKPLTPLPGGAKPTFLRYTPTTGWRPALAQPARR